MIQWYEELFQDYADSYDKESFTTGTKAEVDFFEMEIGHNKSAKILDIACGTGRHSLELARRNYEVTGIDLSVSQLKKAKLIAGKEKLKIEFLEKDARNFDFNGSFDLAIMICEGAFPLMETDEMNFSILKNACSSVKKGCKLIFTTLNGLYPLFHSVRDFLNDNSSSGKSVENSFDLMTFRDHSVYETLDDNGRKRVLKCNERYYVPSEISWLVKTAGFCKSDIYSCKLGGFSRNDILSADDFEMLVIAEK